MSVVSLLVLLILVVFGLVASVGFFVRGIRDFGTIKDHAWPSDICEHSRHVWQQGFKTVKLILLTAVLVVAILMPEGNDIRTTVMRGLLISVIALIVVSVMHERRATKKVVATMLKERQESESGFDLYRVLVESNPWGVLAVDENFDIRFMNDAMERLCGWSLAELWGHHLNALIPSEDREVHAEHERDFKLNPRVRHGDYPVRPKLLRRDGTTIDVEISLAPIDSPDGPYYYASVRDRETLPNSPQA